jgi:serine protease Do
VVEDAEGHAAEAGIQPGDVVLSVDGTPVQSVSQLRKLVQDHGTQVARSFSAAMLGCSSR